MDVIGVIDSPASNGHRFILVGIEYFTKWAETASYKHVTKKVVSNFLRNNIICRFGVPETLITDIAKNLNNDMVDRLCEQFKVRHRNSAIYMPQMNGAVETANKNLKKIIRKMTETYRDWHEKLPYALMAYRTTISTSTEATSYSLMYGMETVLPAEVEIPSLRILMEAQIEDAEWIRERYEQLSQIDEKRLNPVCHGQCYQQRMTRVYNKKVKPCMRVSSSYRINDRRASMSVENVQMLLCGNDLIRNLHELKNKSREPFNVPESSTIEEIDLSNI
ncbi:uncharacterized protein [Coffea arabica]|uniref:Integrase catalytic domain-containing protein n=1 Tax=Coffea arabica TaxID=13443 RepID=A0A6P6T0L0_COFAR